MIQDYECRPEDSDHGMLEVIRTYQLPVPEIYVKMEEILRFAKLEKNRTGNRFVRFRLIIHWKPGRWAGTCVMEMRRQGREQRSLFVRVLRS